MNSRLELGSEIYRRGLKGDGVEVGVLFGEYSECLLSTWDGVLHMVDPWIQQSPKIYCDGCNAVDLEGAFEKTKNRLAKFYHRARYWRMFSVDAAPHFKNESLAFVYLDGNHREESVEADLTAWWGRIMPGGILGGHDYYDNHTEYQDCGVRAAVDRFVLAHDLTLTTTADTSWFVDKSTP